jgi:hypothetical protein
MLEKPHKMGKVQVNTSTAVTTLSSHHSDIEQQTNATQM